MAQQDLSISVSPASCIQLSIMTGMKLCDSIPDDVVIKSQTQFCNKILPDTLSGMVQHTYNGNSS